MRDDNVWMRHDNMCMRHCDGRHGRVSCTYLALHRQAPKQPVRALVLKWCAHVRGLRYCVHMHRAHDHTRG